MFVNSADPVLELLYGSVSLDVNVEACLGSQSEPRLRHEWRRHRPAMSRVTIGQEFNAKFRTHIEENPAQPLELQINEVELFSVSGVQRKTISTMALNLNDAARIPMNQNQFCRIGSLGGNNGSSVQFFEVSELNFRNARFKQAIQQRKTMICGSMLERGGAVTANTLGRRSYMSDPHSRNWLPVSRAVWHRSKTNSRIEIRHLEKQISHLKRFQGESKDLLEARRPFP